MSRPRVSRRLCSITASASMVLAGLTVGVSARSAGDADEDVAATRALGLLAAARPVRVPGNFEGVGFDVCSAPDQATMDALRTESPYWGVGVYIGGANRTCDQPELTAAWIHTQHARGWHIFPIFIGLQAPVLHRGTSREVWCIDGSRHRKPMRANNEMAREQGRLAAIRAVGRAHSLRIATGSTLFLDIESYDNTRSRCNQPVLNFVSAWSRRLHTLGWKAGYYSSAGTGIRALDYLRSVSPETYVMPDVVWFGWSNGRQNLEGEPYLRDGFWPNQRVHQYDLNVLKRFGTIRLRVDQNVIRVGRGSRPGRVRHTCGVRVSSPAYSVWDRGDRNRQIAAAQCMLKQRGLFRHPLTGRFGHATAKAVGRFQVFRGLPVSRRLTVGTWTALLASGTTPLVKRGSASDRVRFLQRALTAATRGTVSVDGIFGGGTTLAVRRYQHAVGLDATGVVDRSTWRALQRGRH